MNTTQFKKYSDRKKYVCPISWRWLGIILLVILSVMDITAQCNLSCRENIQLSLFNRDALVISPEMVLINANSNCPNGDFEIKITDNEGKDLGNQIDYQYVGKQLIYQVTDKNTGEACQGFLKVEDRIAPTMNCEAAYVACYESILPESIGYPNATDNIDDLEASNFSYEDFFNSSDCADIVNGQRIFGRITRNWSVKDNSNNTKTCTQTIYIQRPDLSLITFPEDRNNLVLPALSCGVDNPNDLLLTGVPQIAGIAVNEVACGITVTHEDQVTTPCIGSKKILRTWRIVDDCNDTFVMDVQEILVNDTTAPIITCPNTMRFATTTACGSTVNLTQAVASDACGTVTVSVAWEFGVGYGPFYNVPAGEHEVVYTATDDCGNQTTCTARVLVEDSIAPTAVCANNVEVLLDNEGKGILYAQQLDGGSTDNCNIENYQISKNGHAFGDIASFSCEDIANSPVSVTLRVYDVSGRYDECTTTVMVQDESAPTISCPPAVTINCDEDRTNLNLTGEPIAMDLCGVKSMSYTDNINNLNVCGYGVIERTWTAEDIYGNKTNCLQYITIEDETPIEVIFPDDVVLNICGADVPESSIGTPTIIGKDCELNVGINYEDQVFPISYPACYKILRKWTVVDWCRHDPNIDAQKGRWEYTQTIEIQDVEKPVVTLPPLDEYAISGDGCEGYVHIPTITATDCSSDLTYGNNSAYANTSGADASGTYPVGQHTITYSATDGCGNTTRINYSFIVKETVAPIPVCVNTLSIPLNAQGYVNITPEMVGVSATDNCTPKTDIKLTLTPSYFTCSDVGFNQVKMTATDAYGNESYCYTTIQIQDNANSCANLELASIEGRIRTSNGAMLTNIMLSIDGDAKATAQSSAEGYYVFNDLAMQGSYIIKPITSEDYNSGITTFDLIKIRKHVLNVEPFSSPYQYIAADVNNSGSVSTFDLVVLQRLILNIIPKFDNSAWKFVDATYQFPEGENPLLVDYPQQIVIDRLDKDKEAMDFIAVKIGDVNGSVSNINMENVLSERSSDKLNLTIIDNNLTSNTDYTIPVYAQNFEQIEGFQFTFDFDTDVLDINAITPATLPNLNEANFGWKHYEDGKITVSWNHPDNTPLRTDEPLFNIQVTAKKTANLQSALTVNAATIAAEAYRYDETIIGVALSYSPKEKTNLIVQESHPNPFHHTTTVMYDLPEATDVTISIYHNNGQLIKRYQAYQQKGLQSQLIDLTNLPETGILFLTIDTPIAPPIQQKLVRIKE